METIVNNISQSLGNNENSARTNIQIGPVSYTNAELKFCLPDRRNRIKLHEIKHKRQRFNFDVDQTYAEIFVDGTEIQDRLYCQVCADIIAKPKKRGCNLKRHLSSRTHKKAKFLRQFELVPINLL